MLSFIIIYQLEILSEQKFLMEQLVGKKFFYIFYINNHGDQLFIIRSKLLR